ncbi:MAG: universal stress protein [Gemmataceae bacterium]|nr:universal stress protein [Gemmataceae bacterium]
MFRSLLVPLDGSSFGEQALPLAELLARQSGAALALVHAHEPLDVYIGTALAGELEEEARQRKLAYLEKVAAKIKGAVTGEIKTTVVVGAPAQALREYVEANGIDLIVMTTHGRGAFNRFWLGSVADDLMRHVAVPLLLVRPRDTTVPPGSAPAIRSILVPLDGSALAEKVLGPAGDLAHLTGAAITLIRVTEPVADVDETAGHTMLFSASLHAEITTVRKRQAAEAEAYLEAAAQRLRAVVPDVRWRLVQAWNPASAILDDAKAHGADVIALATHGQGGLVRLLIGSVADKVVRGAEALVLVYRPGNDSLQESR